MHEPLQTGIKAIDAMTPIGRGQRQLIIGDRKTGKTAIAIDTIINQKAELGVGRPDEAGALHLRRHRPEGLDHRRRARRPRGGRRAGVHHDRRRPRRPTRAGFKYLAPYTGSAIGQHWMYDGKHVLIIFDDLTKQAEAYRAVSLLLRRPPGREAYPGDVFYLHSRLLERCAKLSDELGAGSMTGLPIIETKANDVSAYIPTNVISITDGQIFLQSDLFNAEPAPGHRRRHLGVPRRRLRRRTKAMKTVSGSLKVDLAQFRALEAFAMFASDLDAASRQQLDRGQRLMELLKQPQYSPYPVEEQVVSLWAGTSGQPRQGRRPATCCASSTSSSTTCAARTTGILATIRETQKFEDDTEQALAEALRLVPRPVRDLRRPARSRPATSPRPRRSRTRIEQEQIVKQKRG